VPPLQRALARRCDPALSHLRCDGPEDHRSIVEVQHGAVPEQLARNPSERALASVIASGMQLPHTLTTTPISWARCSAADIRGIARGASLQLPRCQCRCRCWCRCCGDLQPQPIAKTDELLLLLMMMTPPATTANIAFLLPLLLLLLLPFRYRDWPLILCPKVCRAGGRQWRV
jgi:hypothetical protein